MDGPEGTVQVIIVGGFLGAGKTTMLIEAARLLEASGKRTGIVLNDQGDQLVDTAYGRAQGLDAGEVTGGCFCCRFDDLVDTTIGLAEGHGLDVVLAEAVGSCADLNATVVRPLERYHGLRFDVAPLTVVLEPHRWADLSEPGADPGGTVGYLFRKQLEEAAVVAVHKTDLLDERARAELLREVRTTLPAARVVPTSAATGEGLDELLRIWDGRSSASPATVGAAPGYEIDYDVYADAEAQLAWLNVTFEVHHPRGFVPADWITRLLTGLSAVCAARGAVVGHAKAQASWGTDWAKASLVRAGEAPVTALSSRGPARVANVLVNARVEMDPDALSHLLAELVTRTGTMLGTEADTVHVQCFRPAPPRPTHRLAETSEMP